MTNTYNNDDTLRETIRTFLENLLNAAGKPNTEQLVEFVLGKDFLQTDDDLLMLKQVNGTFRKVEDTFTIGMITDFLGTPEPLKGLELIRYTIPMVFLVSTKVKYDEIKESLDRFVRSLIGEGYEENGFVFATNCTEMTNTEQVQDINGIEYVKLTCSVFISSTKNALLGNFIETYFGLSASFNTRVYPTERNSTRAFIPEETQRNNEEETRTVFKESTWQNNLSFIIDKREVIFSHLIIQLEEPEDLNPEYYRKVVYGDMKKPDPNDPTKFGTDPLEFEKTIALQSISLDGEIGNFALITVVVKKSGING